MIGASAEATMKARRRPPQARTSTPAAAVARSSCESLWAVLGQRRHLALAPLLRCSTLRAPALLGLERNGEQAGEWPRERFRADSLDPVSGEGYLATSELPLDPAAQSPSGADRSGGPPTPAAARPRRNSPDRHARWAGGRWSPALPNLCGAPGSTVGLGGACRRAARRCRCSTAPTPPRRA